MVSYFRITVHYVINIMVFLDEEMFPDFKPTQRRRIFLKILKCTNWGAQVKTVILHFDSNSICHLKNNNYFKSCFADLMR